MASRRFIKSAIAPHMLAAQPGQEVPVQVFQTSRVREELDAASPGRPAVRARLFCRTGLHGLQGGSWPRAERDAESTGLVQAAPGPALESTLPVLHCSMMDLSAARAAIRRAPCTDSEHRQREERATQDAETAAGAGCARGGSASCASLSPQDPELSSQSLADHDGRSRHPAHTCRR